jgi:hypothetical protein
MGCGGLDQSNLLVGRKFPLHICREEIGDEFTALKIAGIIPMRIGTVE